MRIAFGIQSLTGGGGTETYVLTVADQLQRTGHDVWVYSAETGPWEAKLEAAGLRVAIGTEQLPETLDVCLIQDGPSAFDLLADRPTVPQIYVWHSNLFDVQLPPQLPDVTRLIVSLYGAEASRVQSIAIKSPVLYLRQPIDLQRFAPRVPISPVPKRAVLIGNYLTGERRQVLITACKKVGIELELFGARESRTTTRPEEEMLRADIVFGKARVIMEAMGCGRAAYVYDGFGTDGWVTPENLELLMERGISGTATSKTASLPNLLADLKLYDPAMGEINRDLALNKFSSVRHTSALVSAIQELLGQELAAPTNDHASELARLARVSWRHELQAFGLNAQLQETWTVLAELKRREADFERNERAAEEAERKLAAIVDSTRWRLLSALLRPFDRLRSR